MLVFSIVLASSEGFLPEVLEIAEFSRFLREFLAEVAREFLV